METTAANPELDLAFSFVGETGCNVFLTGKAGTGKTTFLKELQQKCSKRTVVTAPTGVAAINSGGVTLHSFFQLPFGPFIPGTQSSRQHKFNRKKRDLIRSLDLLVIDEISMVRGDILDSVDDVLRRLRRSSQPFGGVQLLLIGDLNQLPPVVKNDEWRLLGCHYSSPYFFTSKALAETELVCIELKHIYRQTDHCFIELLNKVRDNKLDSADLQLLNSRVDPDFNDNDSSAPGYITLCSHNANADAINRTQLENLDRKTCRFHAEIEGEFPEHSYPAPEELTLKVGAQVMFVKNDNSFEKRFFNGKIGRVTSISGDTVYVRCEGDDEEITVEPVTWDNISYSLDNETMEITEDKIGAYIQYPLKLAWAITIHKSQGLTFDRAAIDAKAAFAHGQVYVALSRCRTLEGLVLRSPIVPGRIKTDRSVLEFTATSSNNIPTPEKLHRARLSYQRSLLLDCFNFGRLQAILNRLCGLAENSGGLLRIGGSTSIDTLQQKVATGITTVGSNFGRQLTSLFDDQVPVSEDPVILDRINKGSIYFQEKIKQLLTDKGALIEAESDNSELKKKAEKNISRLQEEAHIKLAAVTCCETGFDAHRYLRAISRAGVESVPKRSTSETVSYTEEDIEHHKLYAALKTWRTQKAKGENLTPFQVMHLKTLIQIAATLPTTTAALKKVKGIGDKLAARYGDELVDMVTDYCNRENITDGSAPSQKDVSSALQPSGTKKKNTRKESLELFLAGNTTEQIAKMRNLTTTTIENHLAYYIAENELSVDSLVAPEKREEIEHQLKSCQSGRLTDVKAALGPGFSYGEIRLVKAHLESSS
ncbi:helix-turn-helix domain-containing protein [Desulforhopalus singaporensis]|uniref:Helicase n=1 Tax=Desulforhopalus singaporensis TaxID=91360 RepID=A0A1H0RK55_9BACT|nr:helix-turn-helix domain-containing protein [Desulforhopalus singaporensis]SDP29825.1 Helicase [Desulforhopalus singaporensis]